MATLISFATGNFTASGSWSLCDTAADQQTANGTVNIGTSNIDSPTFTPGAITVDGVAINVFSRLTTGTFTITLRNSTAGSDVASVTVNVTDLGLNGWNFFKFGSSHLLLAATNYIVRVVCSNSGNQVVLNRSTSGTNNITKALRTTTNQAPAANDLLIMVGELTGAGTGNSFTITNDNTATTSFGPTVSGGPTFGICCGQRGTFTFGTSASTDYYFKWKGIFHITSGGTVNVGTSGTPIPATSTATLECDSVANVDTGVLVDRGTLNMYGPTKRVYTTMTANAIATATVLTVADTTGWENGDELGLAGSVVPNQQEQKTISTVDSATQITLTAGITNARNGGSTPNDTEVLNLSRRVRLRGMSTSLCGYLRTLNGGVVNLSYVEFKFLGSGTTNFRGVTFDSAATHTVTGCSWWSFHASAIWLVVGSGTSTVFVLSDCVIYAIANGFDMPADDVASRSISGCVIVGGSGLAMNLRPGANAFVFKNNRYVTSNRVDIRLVANAVFTEANWENNYFRTGQNGTNDLVRIGSDTGTVRTMSGVLKDWKVYFGGGGGLLFGSNAVSLNDLQIVDSQFIGNARGGTTHAGIFFSTNIGSCILDGCTLGSWSTGPQLQHWGFLFNATYTRVTLKDCLFGTGTGVQAHGSADIELSQSYGLYEILGINTDLASGTPVTMTSQHSASYVRLQRQGQTSGEHANWFQYGRINSDAVIFRSGAMSERLTPNNASNKLQSGSRLVAVESGQTADISAYVRTSVIGDGAAYNGNAPRLIVKYNSPLVSADTVLDTYSVGAGNWEELTGSVGPVSDDGALEFIVDCDGTAGWVNTDDWTVSVS